MKKLLPLVISMYALNLAGCESAKLSEQELMAKPNLDQERYEKMRGKTAFCIPQPGYSYVGQDGKPVQNSSIVTPNCH